MNPERPDQDARLARLFAAAVLGDWDELRRVREGAPAGEPDRAWREALLMVHLFAGVPRQVEAYEVLERAGGLGSPPADEVLRAPAWVPRAAPLFDEIYGENAESVRARLAAFHPDFADWVLDHAYGRVLSRPGLSAARRERLAVAALALTAQERQLASHARGAIACGATPAQLDATLDAVADLAPPEVLERARSVLSRFAR